MTPGRYPAPLLYVGSKRGAEDQVLDLLRPALAAGAHYIEPFVGGGAVYIAARAQGVLRGAVTLSDRCAPLTEAWLMLRNAPGCRILAAELEALAGEGAPGREVFDRARERLRGGPGRAAPIDYMVVNRLGFNGLWRESLRGECNVPPGFRAKDPGKHLRVAAAEVRALGNLNDRVPLPVTVQCADALAVLGAVSGLQAIYLDPAYLGTFTGYGPTRVDSRWTRELYQAVDALDLAPGSVAVASNSVEAAPYVPPDWWSVERERSGKVSSKTSSRGTVTELLSGKVWV